MSSENEETLKEPSEKRAKLSSSTPATTNNNPTKIRVYTFTADHDKFARLELLSSHTLYDLVKTLCKHTAIGYEGSEGPNSHLWDIKYEKRTYPCSQEFSFMDEFYDDDSESSEEFEEFDSENDSDSKPRSNSKTRTSARATKLRDLKMVPNKSILHLNYDYGACLKYVLRLVKCEDLTTTKETQKLYPRNQIQSTIPTNYEKFVPTGDFNLDTMFPHLQKLIFEKGGCNAHLFQAGSKQNFGFISNNYGKMIFIPAKPDTLADWLGYFDRGARAYSHPDYTWHSVVILPRSKVTPQLEKKYLSRGGNTPGFTDVLVTNGQTSDILTKAFPKIAALSGLKKDKKVSKGWISLSVRGKQCHLSICSGKTKDYKSNAPKGTAFDGEGHHNAVEKPLFVKSGDTIKGLHDLFCEVEGLLMTL